MTQAPPRQTSTEVLRYLSRFVQPRRDRDPVEPTCGQHICIIANPHAGGHQRLDALLQPAVRYLRRHVADIEVCWTTEPGHARELAAAALERGATAIVAAGGDGTLNEIAQAVMGTDVAVGVLPLGTVNVWAREMGIGLAPVRAAQTLVHGARRRVDVGRVNGRAFLLMVGIGLDGEVAHVVEQGKHGGLRKLAVYIPTVINLALRYQGTRVKLILDGRRQVMRALMIVIGNIRLYGGAFAFTPDAQAADGMLDVCVIEDQPLWKRGLVFLRALIRRPALTPHVRYLRCRQIEVQSNSRLFVQVDGETFGRLPVKADVVPGALSVILPARLPHGASLERRAAS
jgi:YegS/Rv2252/BmrU family lipid kinase